MFKFIIIGLVMVTLIIIAWSPWMSQDESSAIIYQTAAITKDGERCTEQQWTATWAPFGRMVRHCDRSWYVGFWEAL